MTRSGPVPLLLLLAAAAGCTPGAARPAAAPPASFDPYEVCWNRAETEECTRGIERELLAQAPGPVRREGARLLFRTGQGRVVPLENDTTEGDRYVHYLYQGYLRDVGYHLVQVGFYEGGAYELVSAESGDRTQVAALPVVSPDLRRFVTASVDLEAGYVPNGLQVWRLTPAGPRLEWGLDGGDTWGASGASWRGPGTVEFVKETRTLDPGTTDRARMRLVLRGRGLAVEPAGR
ncbi:MAG TPA: hypothetical protein VF263_16400 [Longimicrobiaceae bacterium]